MVEKYDMLFANNRSPKVRSGFFGGQEQNMNQWGLWFTFFLPAFLGGLALGVSVMAAVYRRVLRRKKARRMCARPCSGSQNAAPILERCA